MKPVVHTALPLIMAAWLAGCANWEGLTPQGSFDDPARLTTGQAVSGITLSDTAWPSQDWWKQLGDTHLDTLIDEALRNSPDLQVADARARQASAEADAADADRGPTLDANAAVTRSRAARIDDPTGQGNRLGTLRSLSANFSYRFDLWGGKRAAWEAALGQARAADLDRRAARLTVSANVARAYSQLAYARQLFGIAEDDRQRTGRMLALSDQRLDAGLDSQYQYQQTESLAAAADAQLTQARQDLQVARIELAVLLGQGPDRGLAIEAPAPLDPLRLALPSSLPAELLGRRPDVVAARWRAEAAQRGIDASKANFLPNLDLTAGAGTKSVLGDALLGSPSKFWSIGPALSLPIFDSGRLRADLAGRDADYDLAVATYNQTLVNALGDIGETVTRLRYLDRQIAEQQRARDIAERSYDLAMQRYGSGIGNYLDALSIEQQLLQAERSLAQLQQQRIDNGILLTQALGGGFQPTPADVQARNEALQ